MSTYTLVVRCGLPYSCAVSDEVVVTVKDCSTPVIYAGYTAVLTHQGAGVRVTWTTLAEQDTLGFRVMRYVSPQDPGRSVTSNVVPARGPAYPYSVLDDLGSLANSNEITYKVIELSAGGRGSETPRFGIAPKQTQRSLRRERDGRRTGAAATDAGGL